MAPSQVVRDATAWTSRRQRWSSLPSNSTCAPAARNLSRTTWPLTSQSNKRRSAASYCLTQGAASSRIEPSIKVVMGSGWTAAIDGTPKVRDPRRGYRDQIIPYLGSDSGRPPRSSAIMIR
jgi:hypothetical protein